MKENTMLKTNSATDYIRYALYAFGGLGVEILLMMIETNLYGQTSGTWSTIQHIIHWMITCLVWGCLGAILVKQLPVIPKNCTKKKNMILVVIIISASIIYTSLVWKGFKPIIELSNLGVPKFLIQYIYYAFESLLIMLIIAHGQKAFENWFSSISILPFGGMILAVTWGLVHIFTQGASTGIYAVIQALLYGSVYMVFNKNYKITYIAIALMFML
ncbi:MAG: hypothetical protein RSC19_05170 [Lachnospiraceae bacterium]